MNNSEFSQKFNSITNNKYECFRISSVDLMLKEAQKNNANRFESVNVIVTFLVPFANYTELMTDENKDEITAALKKILPPFARIEIRYQKSYSTAGDVLEKVLSFISTSFPIIKTQTTADSIKVRKTPEAIEVDFLFEPILEGMIKESGFAEKIKTQLESSFTDTFSVNVSYLAENIIKSEDEISEKQEILADRNEVKFTRTSEDDKPLFGKILGGTAHTIKSRLQQDGKYETICGQIKSFRSGISKKGNKYYFFRVSDKTAEIGIKYFARSDKETPLDNLKEGDEVVCTGNIEEERENEKFPTKYPVRSMTLSALDYCVVDYDSIQRGKVYRKIPEHYTRVFPQTISDPFENEFTNVFFEKKQLNPYLKGEYVVFDLETTGLSPETDYIIEIGAVLLRDGYIVEQFGTFVKPPVRLSQGIIELTHITEEMLKDAPEIQDVLGDFYKFIAGRKLIAYNANFDVSFIRRDFEEYRYKFTNAYDDALEMARKAVTTSNHKLETMCEFYNIDYPIKHRAVGDAMVTAELVKRIKRDEV